MSSPNNQAQDANGSLPVDETIKITHTDGVPIGIEVKPETDSVTVKHLPAKFYSNFISAESRRRKPNSIRGLFPLEKVPGVISLLAGKPNPSTFPISNLQVTVRSPPDSTGNVKEDKIDINGSLLAAGLQYGSTAGYEPLVEWIEGLQKFSHGRAKGEGWRVSMGSGSQDILYKAFHALINPGDSVLVESPVYSGVLPLLDELRGEIIPIETDADGIKASSLKEVLENWPEAKPLPKFLYTVPYGCNPTGMTASTARRIEVLELARKYNFLILEDDPYYYLYYGKAARPPSYFTLELQQPEVGRVVRFDSLSKILSAGIRIGFVSGPIPILNAIDLHTQTANLQVASLTQAVAYSVLESWGYETFIQHTEMVSEFYRQKRDVFDAAMQRHLAGLAEWCTPEAGMFFWFKLLLSPRPSSSSSPSPASATASSSPAHPSEGDDDSEELIRTKAFENGVLALPGTSFLATGGKTAYVRASFSLSGPEDVEEAVRRLKVTILQERERMGVVGGVGV